MSDLKPLSQNRPGGAPAWTRTAMRRAAESAPTSRYFGPLSLIWSPVGPILGMSLPCTPGNASEARHGIHSPQARPQCKRPAAAAGPSGRVWRRLGNDVDFCIVSPDLL